MNPGQVSIIGCGNILFGDDGFGPGVIDHLQKKAQLPEGVEVIDAGTGAGELLLDALLGESKLEKIILVDAMDWGLVPGTVREIEFDKIPQNKRGDFSIHQFLDLNILNELKLRKGIDVRILGCQVQSIPEEIEPGLSPAVESAIEPTIRLIFQILAVV